MTYYKAIRKGESGSLGSAICTPPVEYKVGEWTVAPEEADLLGYGLLVFDDLEKARDFVAHYGLRIYECEVRGIVADPPPMRHCFCPNPWTAVGFEVLRISWPDSTVMVTAVKLLEVVE